MKQQRPGHANILKGSRVTSEQDDDNICDQFKEEPVDLIHWLTICTETLMW